MQAFVQKMSLFDKQARVLYDLAMIRFLFLTLGSALLLLLGFEFLRWLPLVAEIKFVLYLLFLGALLSFYVKACQRFGYDWD